MCVTVVSGRQANGWPESPETATHITTILQAHRPKLLGSQGQITIKR